MFLGVQLCGWRWWLWLQERLGLRQDVLILGLPLIYTIDLSDFLQCRASCQDLLIGLIGLRCATEAARYVITSSYCLRIWWSLVIWIKSRYCYLLIGYDLDGTRPKVTEAWWVCLGLRIRLAACKLHLRLFLQIWLYHFRDSDLLVGWVYRWVVLPIEILARGISPQFIIKPSWK